MNKVVLVGRLTKEPDLRYTQGENPTAVCRYNLAVNRRFKQGEADFINCVVFGKSAEFAEKYFSKGLRVAISGRIQTGSYKNKEGQTVYTTDIVVEEQEFAQSRTETQEQQVEASKEGFMQIPTGIDEELPFL